MAASLLAAAAWAQTAPAFDAATLKLNTANDQPLGDYKNGRLIVYNMSLRSFIGGAYHVPNEYIFGPNWLDSVRLDLSAKTDAGTSEDDWRLMMRTLLEEKLQLKVHFEKKVLAVYALKIAKNGPKFSESKPDQDRTPGCAKYHPLECYDMTAPALLNALYNAASSQFDLPVREMTGLKGRYDFRLSLEPDASGQRVSIFDAVEEQLGLKLERMKQSIDAIIVDHVERAPADN
jgi:uncharacterized protein (TIGR03435 family)